MSQITIQSKPKLQPNVVFQYKEGNFNVVHYSDGTYYGSPIDFEVAGPFCGIWRVKDSVLQTAEEIGHRQYAAWQRDSAVAHEAYQLYLARLIVG